MLDEARHPHMMAVKNCFIRGSVVRYVQLPADQVDTNLLEDATRRGASPTYSQPEHYADTCDPIPQRPTARANGDAARLESRPAAVVRLPPSSFTSPPSTAWPRSGSGQAPPFTTIMFLTPRATVQHIPSTEKNVDCRPTLHVIH